MDRPGGAAALPCVEAASTPAGRCAELLSSSRRLQLAGVAASTDSGVKGMVKSRAPQAS
jgi:hypothetical protein